MVHVVGVDDVVGHLRECQRGWCSFRPTTAAAVKLKVT
jgi:hypothetical protein